MGRTGFEPVKAKPVDLQSTPFGHSGTYPSGKVEHKHLLIPVNAKSKFFPGGYLTITGTPLFFHKLSSAAVST